MNIGKYVPSSTGRWAMVGGFSVLTALCQVNGMNRNRISQGELTMKVACFVAGLELACIAAYRCYSSSYKVEANARNIDQVARERGAL